MTKHTWSKPLLQYISTQETQNITFKTPPQQLEQGVETIIYKIQLKNAPTRISQPLVLRMYKTHSHNNTAQIEGLTQNYLHENNYPAPKVHYICTDTTVIGTSFIIMDYIEGETLSKHGHKVASTLAEYMIKLHQIDPKPLQKRFKSAGIPEKQVTGLGNHIEFLESKNVKWLDPAIEWLLDNEPVKDKAVIHDDLHAVNVQFKDGRVSGVLDWSGIIDDRLRDVGSTLVIYNLMAPSIFPDRREEFKGFTKEFLGVYSSVFPVDSWRLGYFEAVRCFRVMVDYEIGFERVRVSGMYKPCYDRFKEVSGLELNTPW
jgi:aminoglycoside phosphotransferase (APT) family kinase protein